MWRRGEEEGRHILANNPETGNRAVIAEQLRLERMGGFYVFFGKSLVIHYDSG